MIATGTLTCPVAALRMWLKTAGIIDGPVFRAIGSPWRIATCLSDRAIALIVKRRAGSRNATSAGIPANPVLYRTVFVDNASARLGL